MMPALEIQLSDPLLIGFAAPVVVSLILAITALRQSKQQGDPGPRGVPGPQGESNGNQATMRMLIALENSTAALRAAMALQETLREFQTQCAEAHLRQSDAMNEHSKALALLVDRSDRAFEDHSRK